ncbi:hypothetical protein L596_015538 [Steinernema carpocapsae]|uniref:Uncharacterized protein n=1 Tax=Steinernema carpocapsae TaxID=34508 RepID=A0A4U5NFF8_STECR|nr:hypothetical protein L596_015538 [Steinernema carpocapsae]
MREPEAMDCADLGFIRTAMSRPSSYIKKFFEKSTFFGKISHFVSRLANFIPFILGPFRTNRHDLWICYVMRY